MKQKYEIYSFIFYRNKIIMKIDFIEIDDSDY